jgi:hypothetical protein
MVKIDKNGKALISQWFIRLRLIYNLKNKQESMGYQENKLVSYDSF